jgi:hypothetical protein
MLKMSEMKYRPRMRFYHANSKGSGCALSLEMIPADHEMEGCIMATLANQATIGNMQGESPVYSTFNWEGAVTVKLGFNDLCKMLQVLRGHCESIEDGRGLFHRSANANTKISFCHVHDQYAGYVLDVCKVADATGGETRARIMLAPWEALGLSEAISGAMSAICFGLPQARVRSGGEVRGEHRKSS